ncbi:MAG: T9SS type A sorting domain-containing protein [Bacteroidota bacterium]|nr:T9SS type A sorting domain-containing protein [Bacteroidota bacterium]
MKTIILLFGAMMLCLNIGAQVKVPDSEPDKLQVAVAPTNKESDKGISVFPNPSNNGKVFLEISGFKGQHAELRVLNVIGNVVHRENFYETEDKTTKVLDLSKFASGLYYVKIEADEYSQIRKVIIN